MKERLHTLCFRTVLVDHWIFGPHIENHIGTELSIHLAKELPDKWIVIAHSGGFKLIETMLLTRTIKNIFYDLSLTQLYFKALLLKKMWIISSNGHIKESSLVPIILILKLQKPGTLFKCIFVMPDLLENGNILLSLQKKYMA